VSTVVVRSKRHGCLTQILWFLFIGWWAGQLWMWLSWIVMVTILGIPLAIMMLNKLPQIIALREQSDDLIVQKLGDVTVVSQGEQPQRNIILRALYFLLIGWWFSFIWMELAYLACVTLIGLPLGFWMFDRVPAILSLKRT